MKQYLTHINKLGQARMVNIGDKSVTERMAVAKCEVTMLEETLEVLRQGNLKKGDIFSVSKISGILAAKRTYELIPLCHQIQLSDIDLEFEIKESLPGIEITGIVHSQGKTGVEMEALTAVTIAALTVYDMAKSVEKTMKIHNIRLVEKRGGQSGDVALE